MYKNIFFICVALIISACDNRPAANDEMPGEQSSPVNKSLTIEEALSSELSDWMEHWSIYFPDFSIEKFQKGEEGELQDLYSDLIPELIPGPLFQEKLIYSPDGSRYLDLYSYKLIISSKEGELIGGINPDAEAVIIDPEKETRNRVLFMGPAGGIEDAAWLSNEEFLITGFGEIESGKISPLFWHINLNNKSITSHEYPATTQYEQKAYLQKKFPGVKFD